MTFASYTADFSKPGDQVDSRKDRCPSVVPVIGFAMSDMHGSLFDWKPDRAAGRKDGDKEKRHSRSRIQCDAKKQHAPPEQLRMPGTRIDPCRNQLRLVQPPSHAERVHLAACGDIDGEAD